MRMFAGLDVGFKRTSVCIVDETGKIVWRGCPSSKFLTVCAWPNDRAFVCDVWPAPGFEDAELGVFMGSEVSHGETKV
jgi:hypothetical protein